MVVLVEYVIKTEGMRLFMRAGLRPACRMKSVDRGQEMPVELLPARSQYPNATAGISPAACSFFSIQPSG